MKPLFFSLFVFISFTVAAQFPKPGHNGYKRHVAEDFGNLFIKVYNSKDTFEKWNPGRDIDPSNNAMIAAFFQGHKYLFNEEHCYYYSNFKDGNEYFYTILTCDLTGLIVYSRYNDTEFKRCKKMLEKEPPF